MTRIIPVKMRMNGMLYVMLGAGDDQRGLGSRLDQGLTGRKNAERDWQGGRKRCPIEVGQDEEDWRGEGGEVTGR